MKPLKVLIPVDHAVGLSGPHRNVVGSLNALGARDDVEVTLLTSMIDRNEPYARARNIDIRLGFAPHDAKRIPGNVWRIQHAARGCDVVYVPTNLTSFLYAQTVRLGRRLVAGPNVTPLPLGRQDAPSRFELRFMCDAWFEASRMRRDHVRRVTGDRSVGHIHHAIDTERFSPAHRNPDIWKRYGVPEGGVNILHVGRDSAERKGVAQLLDAIDALEGRDDLQFVLAGNMSRATQERIGAMPNAHLLGFRMGAELAEIYASADISVVPSRWENFPFTVLEGMASGISVIGARAGGIPEMIEDEQSGMLVDIVAGGAHRGDAGSILAEAIAQLSDDPERRARLGAGARRRIIECFSERRLGEDLMAVLRGEPLPDETDQPRRGDR